MRSEVTARVPSWKVLKALVRSLDVSLSVIIFKHWKVLTRRRISLIHLTVSWQEQNQSTRKEVILEVKEQ